MTRAEIQELLRLIDMGKPEAVRAWLQSKLHSLDRAGAYKPQDGGSGNGGPPPR